MKDLSLLLLLFPFLPFHFDLPSDVDMVDFLLG
jgi:hypothetical protein